MGIALHLFLNHEPQACNHGLWLGTGGINGSIWHCWQVKGKVQATSVELSNLSVESRNI